MRYLIFICLLVLAACESTTTTTATDTDGRVPFVFSMPGEYLLTDAATGEVVFDIRRPDNDGGADTMLIDAPDSVNAWTTIYLNNMRFEESFAIDRGALYAYSTSAGWQAVSR